MLDLRQIAGVVLFAAVGLLALYMIYSAASFILGNIGIISVVALLAAVGGFVYFRSALVK